MRSQRTGKAWREAVEEMKRLYSYFSYASPATMADYREGGDYAIGNFLPPQGQVVWVKRRGGYVPIQYEGDCDIHSPILATALRKRGLESFLAYEDESHMEVGVHVSDGENGYIYYLSPTNYEEPFVLSSPLLKDLSAFYARYPYLYYVLFFGDPFTYTAYLTLREGGDYRRAKAIGGWLEGKLREELERLAKEDRALYQQFRERFPIVRDAEKGLMGTKLRRWNWRGVFSYMERMTSPQGVFSLSNPLSFREVELPVVLAPLSKGRAEDRVLKFLNRILFNQLLRNTSSVEELEKEMEALSREVGRELWQKAPPKELEELYNALGITDEPFPTYWDLAHYIFFFRKALNDLSHLPAERAVEGARRKAKELYSLWKAGKAVPLAKAFRPITKEEREPSFWEKLEDISSFLAAEGPVRARIRIVQRYLKARGLYRGSIDGIWGPLTEEAYRRWKAIVAVERKAAEVVGGKPKGDWRHMRSLVRKAQQRLRELGLYKGPIDGLWGPKTERAYRAWKAMEGKR